MAKCVVYGEVAYLRHAVEREMAESRHAAASLRVPGYVRVSSLRDEMRLSGCLYNRSSAVDVRVLASRGRQANPVLTYETALRRFFKWQSALFMGKWRTSGTQLRGRCAESRHAAASLRVPGYVRVSSLRDEMCLSGASTTALRRFPSASLAKLLPEQKSCPIL